MLHTALSTLLCPSPNSGSAGYHVIAEAILSQILKQGKREEVCKERIGDAHEAWRLVQLCKPLRSKLKRCLAPPSAEAPTQTQSGGQNIRG